MKTLLIALCMVWAVSASASTDGVVSVDRVGDLIKLTYTGPDTMLDAGLDTVSVRSSSLPWVVYGTTPGVALVGRIENTASATASDSVSCGVDVSSDNSTWTEALALTNDNVNLNGGESKELALTALAAWLRLRFQNETGDTLFAPTLEWTLVGD